MGMKGITSRSALFDGKVTFISRNGLRNYLKQNRLKEISMRLKAYLTWLDIIVYEREVKDETDFDHGRFRFQ